MWRKYPNDLNPNVKTIDILDRHVDEQGRLHTTRLLGAEGFFPSWVCRIVGFNDIGYAYEHSITDAKKKTLTVSSRNVTLSGWVDVEETLVYSQHKDNERLVHQTFISGLKHVTCTHCRRVVGSISAQTHTSLCMRINIFSSLSHHQKATKTMHSPTAVALFFSLFSFY